MHKRTLIRNAFVSTLTGLTTTGSRVYGSRLANFAEADIPALKVYLKDETSTDEASGYDGIVECEVMVEAYVKANSTFDDDLDLILEEVQAAIDAARLTTFRSLAKSIFYDSLEVEYMDADQDAGRQIIKFRVQYEQRL